MEIVIAFAISHVNPKYRKLYFLIEYLSIRGIIANPSESFKFGFSNPLFCLQLLLLQYLTCRLTPKLY